jgi:hypothetical protein
MNLRSEQIIDLQSKALADLKAGEHSATAKRAITKFIVACGDLASSLVQSETAEKISRLCNNDGTDDQA